MYRYLDANASPGGWVYRINERDGAGTDSDLSQCLVDVTTAAEQRGQVLALAGLGAIAVAALVAGTRSLGHYKNSCCQELEAGGNGLSFRRARAGLLVAKSSTVCVRMPAYYERYSWIGDAEEEEEGINTIVVLVRVFLTCGIYGTFCSRSD